MNKIYIACYFICEQVGDVRVNLRAYANYQDALAFIAVEEQKYKAHCDIARQFFEQYAKLDFSQGLYLQEGREILRKLGASQEMIDDFKGYIDGHDNREYDVDIVDFMG